MPIKISVTRSNDIPTANELLDMEMKELKKEMSRMRSIANKRIARLEQSGIFSSALSNLQDNYGVGFRFKAPKTKDKFNSRENRAIFLHQYTDLKNFLYNLNSTVKGAKNYINIIASQKHLNPETVNRILLKLNELGHLPQYRGLLEKYKEIINSVIDDYNIDDFDDDDFISYAVEETLNRIQGKFNNFDDNIMGLKGLYN